MFSRKNKRFLTVTLLLGLLLTACGRRDSGEDGRYVLTMANVLAETDVTGHAANKFAELVAEKSEGRIQVRVFHGGQLGSGVETFEAVKNGHIDLAADSFANLASITRAFEAFHLPFLFESRQQMLRAFRSERVQEHVNGELESVNLRWFATFEIGGPREVATTRLRIRSMNDLKGLKLRASRSPLEIATQEAWGAKGVTIDWPETPESLRLGMVDGLTVPYASLHSGRFHEGDLIRHVLDLNFQCYALVVVVNRQKWDAYPEDVRAILAEAARETEAWHVDFVSDYVSRNIREMTEAGVEITQLSPDEYESIKTLTKDRVWQAFMGERGITPSKIELIQTESGPAKPSGWGYQLPE